MKNNHFYQTSMNLPELGIRRLLDTALLQPDNLHLVVGAAAAGRLRYGHHCHDVWELFCPLQGSLTFECLGQEAQVYPQGSLLIVPPGCLHISIDRLEQADLQQVLVMNLPGEENPYGNLSVGGLRDRASMALSRDEMAGWNALLGQPPGALLDQVVLALAAGGWAAERALALVRLLFATFAEIAGQARQSRQPQGDRHLTAAMGILQARYYEPELTVDAVAAAIGLSPSHLARLFRQATGRPLHQTLVDIRLRRAADLLRGGHHSIKEIANLTGWSSQLYFSAAFRRAHGLSPSAFRMQGGAGGLD